MSDGTIVSHLCNWH